MGNIVLLDDLTINKIAAGEVIERPASVVKEVVENSIDAGADNISIEIRNGGISYIRITDNGKGIQADDLEIAFERHATSKIRKAEDLETVKSMGFRGEALASIAAIARVELVTKTENSDFGHRIVVEGGKILLKEEIGCPKGTTITIENLFYNTPVRYKFLKKDFTESGYIEDAVTRIALVNPNIAIKFINTGKTVIQTSGNGDIRDIVYSVYGKDIAENIINVEYHFEDMLVKGVIGKPEIARSNRSNQLFFVNKRYVKDKTLISAAEQSFKGLLPVGKYGFLILNLEIDPHKLDVNVHPAKLEVRFQEENKIFKLVYHAIKEALMKNENIDLKSANSDNEFIDFDKIANFGVEDEEKSEKTQESKGFGKFLKNIMGGGKNEFTTNSENVVEQLYNDKLRAEKMESNLENEFHFNDECGFDNVKEYDLQKELDDLKYLSQKYENEKNNENNNLQYKDENNKQEFDNIIVKENGSIELKNTNLVEESNPVSNNDSNINETKNTEVSHVQHNTNLQRLMKELDENLEKLNLKSVSNIDNSLRNDSLESNNIENNQSISNELSEEKYDKLIENIDNIVKENAEKFDNVNINDKIVSVEDTVEIKNNNENILKDTNIVLNKEETKNSFEINNQSIIDNVEENSKNSKEIDSKISDDKFVEMYEKMFGTSIAKKEQKKEKVEKGYALKEDEIQTAENISIFSNKNGFDRAVYKFIGIAFGEYIIIEYEKEMFIINQYVANERIIYEKLKRSYYSENNIESQLMLLPDIINLTHREMGIAYDNMQLFKKAGFDLDEFGENTIKLSGVPEICIDLDTKELFLEILKGINTVARTAKQEIEEKFLSIISYETSIRTKLAFSIEDVDNLLQQLLVLENPFMCSNGKPVAIRMNKNDIEKKFSRR